MSGQHTPTPWAVDENYPTSIVRVQGEGSVLECEFMEWDGETMNVGEPDLNEANATFIVKAVNSHEALVDILERIKRHGELANVGTGGFLGNKPAGNPMSKDVWQFPRHMLTDIDEALALAKS